MNYLEEGMDDPGGMEELGEEPKKWKKKKESTKITNIFKQ